MEYEIKNISLTSVLKVSFLVSLTVLSILFFFIYLFVIWFVNLIGDAVGELPFSSFVEKTDFSLSGVILGSIFNGILLTVVILFILLMSVIFYNFYAKWVGGINLTIENKLDNQSTILKELNE